MKLSTIVNTLDIATNKWIFLPNTSIITTKRNGNIAVNNSCIFYFDSSNNLLYISQDNKYRLLETLESDKDAYKINQIIELGIISGFVSAYTTVNGLFFKK